MSEPMYQCPGCGDVHGLTDRRKVDGSRHCPECGEPTAIIKDDEPDIIIDETEADRGRNHDHNMAFDLKTNNGRDTSR